MPHRFLPLALFALLAATAPAPVAAQVDADAPRIDTVRVDTLALPETNFYAIETPKGRMVVRLYDQTPAHRDNFKRLAAQAFFDSTTFHRVIEGFMIQGGDPLSKDDDPNNDGMGDPGYTLPAEFDTTLFHKRGALAAAREGDFVNPERRSSGSQFYIVHGTVFGAFELGLVQQQLRRQRQDTTFAFTQAAMQAYEAHGGAPHLDGQYTVFGELVEGFEVLDAIAAAETPRRAGQNVHPAVVDRPTERLWMVVRPLPEYQPPATN